VATLLQEIRPLVNSDWVFPHARGKGHRVAINKAQDRVVAHSAVKFVPLDLRRTAASLMTGMGIGRKRAPVDAVSQSWPALKVVRTFAGSETPMPLSASRLTRDGHSSFGHGLEIL
jgi:hypothetical protein